MSEQQSFLTVSADEGHAASDVSALANDLSSLGTTHIVYVERPGPAVDGTYRSMRGVPISGVAPLEHLGMLTGAYVIGIGDGGNEVGMGKLPVGLIETTVDAGDQIASITSCDALVVAAISNWGACALAACILALGAVGRPTRREVLNPELHYAALVSALRAGAVDGVTGDSTESVDGMDWPIYRQVLDAIDALAGICE